jgi:NADH-quinone oxidoreductase subunit N
MACLFILGSSFGCSPRWWGPSALLAILIGGCGLWYSSGVSTGLLAGTVPVVSHDQLAIQFQWCSLVLGAILVLMSLKSQSHSSTAGEFYGMLLLIISGMMIVSAANELILLFLGLELVSIPMYVLLYLGRRDLQSQESALKYFLLSVLSAAVLLYGFALLYGLTGTTHLSTIRTVLVGSFQPVATGMPPVRGSSLGIVAMVLIFAGLGFKLTAVPFHFYAPDVYQGTSAFNAGVLAVAPKAAGLIALIRVTSETMVGFESSGERVALILAIITMTGGNCLALFQTNIRRMLAYSSVAHAGYMLIGLAVGFWDVWNPTESLNITGELPGGVRAALLYLMVYSLVTIGFFAVLVYLERPSKRIDNIEELTGLGRTQPVMAVAAALFLFSLTGIPPLPGFWGKLAVFNSALSVRFQPAGEMPDMHQGFLLLAIIGVVNAAIGGVYYLRIVALMFLNEPNSSQKPEGGRGAYVAVLGAAALTLWIGLAPGAFFGYVERIELPTVAAEQAPAADALPVAQVAESR